MHVIIAYIVKKKEIHTRARTRLRVYAGDPLLHSSFGRKNCNSSSFQANLGLFVLTKKSVLYYFLMLEGQKNCNFCRLSYERESSMIEIHLQN